ncbi:MAG: hypothetical protein FWF84_00115 [Kiritimatiellaeota bacterium]|nr:hypothetical protein [Kiritimatiellota bacterium]
MTATANHAIQEEVDRNYAFFKKELPRLMMGHLGQFALLKDAEIVDYFDSFNDAEKYADLRYPDGLYSIQKVENVVVKLGFLGSRVYA